MRLGHVALVLSLATAVRANAGVVIGAITDATARPLPGVSVVAEPLAGTTCANEAALRHNESESRESLALQIESVLLIHIPFVVDGDKT